MRLIDADALIHELHSGIFSCPDCKKDYEYLGIDDYIRNQPTAYDVDAVCRKINENKDIDNLIDGDHAIKIVNGGGAHE